MKIAIFTNTYLPHVGGVARSVKTLEDECRELGHEVKVIAPESEGAEESPDVLRVPAIQNFNGSDFAVRLPSPALIREFLDGFAPDIIHSQHPFLLGDSALREAWKREIPIVFTHHTLYERYTHYVPLDSPGLKRAAIQLATEYCNLCNLVIAPSESIRQLLAERGVTTPVVEVPTGIDTLAFAAGDGARFRKAAGIPGDVKLIGHVGRLAREKNLRYLAESVALYLKTDDKAAFLIVGEGGEQEEILEILSEFGGRIHAVGKKSGTELADAYAAMDLFVFSSQSETQGMVLAEAMAAGKPVVALDGPGVREILVDGGNGVMLDEQAPVEAFAEAIGRLAEDEERLRRFSENARAAAADFDKKTCAAQVVDIYESLVNSHERKPEEDRMPWDRFLNGVEIEWDLFAAKVVAAVAVIETPAKEEALDQ